MVESVEHRVEMHCIGRERRAAGKPRWDKTVAISAYIHEEYSEDKVLNAWHVMRNVADLVTAQLGRYLEVGSPDCDWNFAETIDDMRERSLESLSSEEDPVEAVKSYISEVYDFFDYHHIWGGAGAAHIVKIIPTDDRAAASAP